MPPAGRNVGRDLAAEGEEDAHHHAEPDHLGREEDRDLPPGVRLAPALEEQVVDCQAHHRRAVGEVVAGEERHPGQGEESPVSGGAAAVEVEVDEGQRQGEGQRVVAALSEVEEERDVAQGEDPEERGEEPARRLAENPPRPEEEAGEGSEDEGEAGGEGVVAEEADERGGVEVLERGIGAVLDPGQLEASAEGDDVGAVEGGGVAGFPDVGGEDGGVGLVVPQGVGAEVTEEEGGEEGEN